MDILDFLNPTPEMDAISKDPLAPWVPFSDVEKTALTRASLLAQATRCPTAKARHFRMLASMLHTHALRRTLGECFTPAPLGGAVNAEWTRHGCSHRLLLRTMQKPLSTTRGKQNIVAYNTQSTAWTWPPVRDFDYMLAIGYESRSGMDVAVIPEASLRDRHVVSNGQVVYRFAQKDCAEYFKVPAYALDIQWQNFVIGPRTPLSGDTPDKDQEGRANVAWQRGCENLLETLLNFAEQSRNSPLRISK